MTTDAALTQYLQAAWHLYCGDKPAGAWQEGLSPQTRGWDGPVSCRQAWWVEQRHQRGGCSGALLTQATAAACYCHCRQAARSFAALCSLHACLHAFKLITNAPPLIPAHSRRCSTGGRQASCITRTCILHHTYMHTFCAEHPACRSPPACISTGC